MEKKARLMMAGKRRVSALILLTSVICACKTQVAVQPESSTEVSFNEGAGRGQDLFVTVQMQDGERLLFAVDTGEPRTVFDRSLESKLGKCYGTNYQNRYVWYPRSEAHVYKAPALYLGSTRLILGEWVNTDDLSRLALNVPGRQLDGLLGLDCLQHYCVQLDFESSKLRLLDPARLEMGNLGKGYPLSYLGRAAILRAYVGDNLAGVAAASSWIDTGDAGDGALAPRLFAQELANEKEVVVDATKTHAGVPYRQANFTSGSFGGDDYPDLHLMESPDGNVIGLRFLARHLVTFNFPKRVMYLKRQNVGPLD